MSANASRPSISGRPPAGVVCPPGYVERGSCRYRSGGSENGRVIPDVLADRYASDELVAIWSPEEKVRAERRLWLAVLRAQRDLGVPVPDEAIGAYESVLDRVDLASIAARERV